MQHAAPVEERHALGDLAHDAAPEAAAEAEPRLEEEAVERIAAELHGDQDLGPAHGDAVERDDALVRHGPVELRLLEHLAHHARRVRVAREVDALDRRVAPLDARAPHGAAGALADLAEELDF